MKVGFVCPDGQRVRFTDCLTHCRLPERCLTKSTLSIMSMARPWSGKPSTTQLIQPTRIAYLSIIHDWYLNPQDEAWAFIGTRAHKRLDGAATDISVIEKQFEDEEMTGRADNYELENGVGILTDYKTWGSFAVAKALGIKVNKVYARDPYSTHMPPPTLKVTRNAAQADNRDTELQLNRYRIWFEKAGCKVHKLQVQAFVRDGGTESARERGITKNIELIPIRILPDKDVLDYFDGKRTALLSALEKSVTPPACSEYETWRGRRCRSYCPVTEHCDVGRDLLGM